MSGKSRAAESQKKAETEVSLQERPEKEDVSLNPIMGIEDHERLTHAITRFSQILVVFIDEDINRFEVDDFAPM